MTSPALDLFSPSLRRWFAERVGTPTDVQVRAWPRIASGSHLLVTAPTGSGKTLAAFLWALDQLLGGRWPPGQARVLYVSPLRALGNDVQRNLLRPLAELPAYFAADGVETPPVAVLTRTGDTPAEDRRRMLRRPPEILITTPESLNILLTSSNGRRLLGGLRCVLLDEVHAVVGSKRGVHLITAVERLSGLCGELQRIALSATVRPLERVARWVGGYQLERAGGQASYTPRPVEVVASSAAKRYTLEVRTPAGVGEGFWTALTESLKNTIRANRSTLIFANSRRKVEKIARLINEGADSQLAYSHHGALSREIRAVVEERLKAGLLPAIVATSSLELGIDIGTVDEVAMVQTPPSVAAATQRLGRSGHGVGELSRGVIYPLSGRDLLHAAVLAPCVLAGEIEASRPVRGALDVLAQVLLSMVTAETWRVEELYDAVRSSEAYHSLPRRHFDLVLEMLAGRYASTRLRSLRPLVVVDAVDGTVRARPGAEPLLYLSGGTIADRGYYRLRLEGGGALLGELDEEFVWERSVGDTFTLGVQTWRIQRITANDVTVTPSSARSAMAPFWRADERDRSSFLSDRVGGLLERVEARLGDDGLADELARSCHLEPEAAGELVRLLKAQKASTGALPHRRRVVVEHSAAPSGQGAARQLILHTMWGGRVNRPLAYALSAAWAERHGVRPEVVHDDDCVVLTLPDGHEGDDPFTLVTADQVEALLRRHLPHTGFFGARFREAAGCALLLPRAGFHKRTPLWLSRQRAKELLEAVADAEDFPILLEAWRTCLQDELEIELLSQRLEAIRDGLIEVHHARTEVPSPFAAGVVWKQTNTLMYEDDTPGPRGGASLSDELLRELTASSRLRPRLARELVAELESKLQRTAAGYAPAGLDELRHWVAERVLIPVGEWPALLEAVARDHELDKAALVDGVANRVLAVTLPGEARPRFLCHVERLTEVLAALGVAEERVVLGSPRLDGSRNAEVFAAWEALRWDGAGRGLDDAHELLGSLLGEWLRYYGPLLPGAIAEVLGLERERLDRALQDLAEEAVVVIDEITAGASGLEVCDRENLARLLRLARARARPSFATLPAELLPLHLALHQGLATANATPHDLQRALEALLGLPAPAEQWETELLPARLQPYLPAWLDTVLAETELEWIGCGLERVAFSLGDELDLFLPGPPGPDAADAAPASVLPAAPGRYRLEDLMTGSTRPSAVLAARLWEEVWSGRLTSDSFAPVRNGVESGFRAREIGTAEAEPPLRRRRRFDRWRSSRPLAGAWYRLPQAAPLDDPLDAAEAARDQVRTLLDRYGVLFRELLDHELPQLRWGALFRTLRLLELAGEVVAGRFFDGVAGLQFISPSALQRLVQDLPEDLVWWLNAADPASPCGLGLDAFAGRLPRRVATNHLVFHGRRLAVVSERRGGRLELDCQPDDPDLPRYLGFLKSMLGRAVRPRRSVLVETVNGTPAAASAFRASLSALFHVTRAGEGLRLSRRY